jgi:hypothetical protein
VGYWATRIETGQFEDVPLAGLEVVVALDAPQHMIDGDWTEILLIDESATSGQRPTLETIFRVHAGKVPSTTAGLILLLMLTGFAMGVMNMLWMGFLTILVCVEKLVPFGERFAGVAALGMILWGTVLSLGICFKF